MKIVIVVAVVLLQTITALGQTDKGKCIWYSKCSDTENCKYDGPALPWNGTVDQFKNLFETCPEYVYSNSTAMNLCCDGEQITTLSSQLLLAKNIFGRCPGCYRNFRRMFCALTCDPHQSLFLERADKVINYYINPQFGSGFFNSCEGVVNPSSNSRAIAIFCEGSVEKCTVQKVYNFLAANSPFKMNITSIATKPNYVPMNKKTVKCSGDAEERLVPCSCQDCKLSCKTPKPVPPPPLPFTILNIDGWWVIMLIVYLVFMVGFLIGVFIGCVRKRSRSGSRDDTSVIIGSREIFDEDISILEKAGAATEVKLRSIFTAWGTIVANRPVMVILIGVVVCAILGCGNIFFTVTTDPVQLWSSPESTARQEKNFFDKQFAPFYRTEQIIIRKKNYEQVKKPFTNLVYSSVLQLDTMIRVLRLQNELRDMRITFDNVNISLTDICFKPMFPDFDFCTIQSPLNYFQNKEENLNKTVSGDDYLDHLQYCANSPLSIEGSPLQLSCLGSYGGPNLPNVVFGGFDGKEYLNGSAIVVTILVNNNVVKDSKQIKYATAWEKIYLDKVKKFAKDNPDLILAYQAERSVEDEIDRESRSDVSTIIISYLVMFVYVTLTLGHYTSVSRLFIDIKITLGLVGVFIVILSVVCSLGAWSYIKLPATLIIIEVIPFLVLAVGVDNIFILVQAYQRERDISQPNVEESVANVLGKVGPSMLLTSISESVAFFFGALTPMPAVKVFSLYAGLAILFDFLLQITVFVAVMTLDAKRTQNARPDCICCTRCDSEVIAPAYPTSVIDPDLPTDSQPRKGGLLFHLVQNYYSPFLLSDVVRPIVIIVFVAWMAFGIGAVHKVESGLDQKLSMPEDSYMLDYFNAISQYLRVGPPVYFVVRGEFDYTSMKFQNLLCAGAGCPQNSLTGQIFEASNHPEYYKIAEVSSSWLDDYFDWLYPDPNTKCCRYFPSGKFCPASTKNDSICKLCDAAFKDGRPSPSEFMKYLPYFLVDNPSKDCPKGGHAAYGSAVKLGKNRVESSYFMTYHSVLTNSSDFIMAYKRALELANNVNKNLKSMLGKDTTVEVFPYSIFYVFYDQYLTIVYQTYTNIIACLVSIGVVTLLLLGIDFYSTFIILITISMILISLFAMMFLWGISLNALSLVNLVVAIGISVEFCSHIVRAFAVSTQPSRMARAKFALVHMGSSVLSGITLTKLGGIVVLGFAKSQLFKVFYFRMYFGIVLFGALHGLVFLPVFLSYVGPPVNKARLKKMQDKRSRSTLTISTAEHTPNVDILNTVNRPSSSDGV